MLVASLKLQLKDVKDLMPLTVLLRKENKILFTLFENTDSFIRQLFLDALPPKVKGNNVEISV